MTIDDKIGYEKLQYGIKRKTVNINDRTAKLIKRIISKVKKVVQNILVVFNFH